MGRKIDKIILHCSATQAGKDFKAADIDRWHRAQGWTKIGYHFVIDLDGAIEKGRDIEEAGAHVKGQNAHSIGICYVGGVDKNGKAMDTRTDAQKEALVKLVAELKSRYPGATVHGHNEFAAKACPSFNVQEWLKTL